MVAARIGGIEAGAARGFDKGVGQCRAEALPFGPLSMNMYDMSPTAGVSADRMPDVPAFQTKATREVFPEKHGDDSPDAFS